MVRLPLTIGFVLATGASVHATPMPAPSAWWNFDNDGVDDGIIHDQGPNNIDLSVVEFNSLSPSTFSISAREVGSDVPSLPGQPVRYITSGATFPGAGDGFHLEGGRSRSYLSNNVRNEVTQIRDSFTSTIRVQTGNPNSSGAGSNNPLLNPLNDELTYAFWLKLPARVGSDFNLVDGNNIDGNAATERFRANFANREHLIGRGIGDEGHVEIRTIPGFNPNDPAQFADPTYVLNLRADITGPNSGVLITDGARFGVDEWHHFVVYYGPQETKVYMDGLLTDSFNQGIAGRTIGGTFGFGRNFLGSNPEPGNWYIDDVGLWQLELTPDEVQHIYIHGIGRGLVTDVTPAAQIPEPTTLSILLLTAGSMLGYRPRKR